MAVKRYDGSAWQVVAGKGDQGTSSSIATWVKTASGGETSLSGNDDNSQPLSYTVGQELVFINGALQKRGVDYTATTGTSITGLTALVANDVVTVWTVNAFSVANTYTQAQVDAAFVNNTNYWSAGKNKIINGDFYVNQRGFSSETTNAVYTFDRWRTGVGTGGTVTFTPQTFTPGAAPVSGYEGKNYLRIVTSGQTGTAGRAIIQQPIEDVRTLAGQTATVSFWAKASSGTPNINVEFAQVFGSGGSTTVTGIKTTVQTITTSWARYSFTISIPSVSGKTIGDGSGLWPTIAVSSGSDYDARYGVIGNQDNTFDIWGVQVEAGSVATAFQTATGNPASELAACQRYFQRLVNGAEQSVENLGAFQATSTTTGLGSISFLVPMRTAPTLTISAAGDFQRFDSAGSSLQALSTFTFQQISPRRTRADVTFTSGATAGNAMVIIANSANARLDASAEL